MIQKPPPKLVYFGEPENQLASLEELHMVKGLPWIIMALIMGMFASVAYGDEIATYSIDFAGGNLAPTSGSFTLDETTDQFVAFSVTWDAVTFDFLDSLVTKADLFSLGSCPALSASIITSYFLGEGTCTTPANVTWSGNWQSASNEGFNLIVGNGQDGFGFTALGSGTPLVFDDTGGTATASLVTPEPSYTLLTLLFGVLLVLVRLRLPIRQQSAGSKYDAFCQ
jgi:hypothetical protein